MAMGLIQPPTEPKLVDFAADEIYFIVDYESTVVFTVTAVNITGNVDLYSVGSVIGEMNDDGINGDIAANDGTYTYALTMTVHEESDMNYYAQAGGLVSESVNIHFFPTPTEEDEQQIADVQQEITDIEAPYTDENGYVSQEDVSAVIAEEADYAERLYEQGEIFGYNVNEDCIVIKFLCGLTAVYIPNVDDTKSGGSDVSMTIITCEPAISWIFSAWNHLVDDAAEQVASTFSNYTFMANLDNEAVTLNQIKNFSANQVVIWDGHGGYDINTEEPEKSLHSILATGEDYDFEAAHTLGSEYNLDCVQGSIVNRFVSSPLGIKTRGKACITYKFINKYCKNKLNNSFFYIGTCNSGHDEILAKSFLDNGAVAVVGNTNTIQSIYNFHMMNALICNMTQINGATGDYNTLSQALQIAKNKYGETGPFGARPFIFGGTNAENYRFGSVPITFYLEDMPFTDWDRYTGNMGDSAIGSLSDKTGIDGTHYDHGLECWVARWNYTNEISWVWKEWDISNYTGQFCTELNISAASYNHTSYNTKIQIIGDGVVLYEIDATPNLTYPIPICVDISNVHTLRISLHDNVSTSGGTSFLLGNAAIIGSMQEPAPTIPPNIPAVEFNGHYYYLYENANGAIANTWEDALAYCQSLGGYLATITSQEENDFLFNYMKSRGIDTAYFGFTDRETEGVWKWCNGESVSYTNWHNGEPNNSSTLSCGEDYGELYYKFNDGTWNDGDFGNHTQNDIKAFICEWGAYTVPPPPPDGIPTDAAEFNGHYYYLYENANGAIANTWEDALAYCQSLGGYLATITSQEENDFLFNVCKEEGLTAYFGFSDRETEGIWKWCNGESVSYTNWHDGEPNNDTRSEENYAQIYHTDGTWNDSDFNISGSGVSNKAFICEWGAYTQESQGLRRVILMPFRIRLSVLTSRV